MQFTTLALALASSAPALAATCAGVSTGALGGSVCPAAQAGAAWYEMEADCGAVTVTYERARGGGSPVFANINIENTSNAPVRVWWEQAAWVSSDFYYVDLAVGESCDKTFTQGVDMGGVSYQTL